MISAVIPVLDEAESLVELHGELDAVAAEHGYRLDILFVDDGSSDGSWAVIRQLAKQDPRVHGIRFRRNFGKAAALRAGFEAVQGDLVMTLDGDLQDDPREIPHFLAKLKEGYDVISGWKKVRRDPWHKVASSRVFNWLVRRLTGLQLHDHNCGMKCYRREVLADVHLYGEMHRFVPVLAAAKGFRIGEIPVNHRPRRYGKSKYGSKRLFKGFLDLLTVTFLTGFGHRPQHLLGTTGLLSFLAGGMGLFYLAVVWVLSRLPSTGVWWEVPVSLSDRALLYYCLGGLLLGSQLLSLGLLAEMITAFTVRDVPTYSVMEQTGDAPDDRPLHEELTERQSAAAPDKPAAGDV
ncbi:MAG: glycosyltransferase [Planctomycetales bacterium]|nr:glycosyltransferase [Planctomycetales bacterium]NIM09698.1 glycosyltransferase [Planctomycetales bacterium]NIN09175.1 glycosyltransferase [Planctomycetales bacterium]NIN78280.1 glycosyltransferase [Planctomycetales bacterium]NIO35471.1 glycosyltransferase [Planctomycetales bacterium]